MARHESEMHRHRRELLEALSFAAAGFATIANNAQEPAVKALAQANFRNAKAAIAAIQPPCNIGLFQDERQMDLADRRDVR